MRCWRWRLEGARGMRQSSKGVARCYPYVCGDALKEIGVTKTQSSRRQKLRGAPREAFEELKERIGRKAVNAVEGAAKAPGSRCGPTRCWRCRRRIRRGRSGAGIGNQNPTMVF